MWKFLNLGISKAVVCGISTSTFLFGLIQLEFQNTCLLSFIIRGTLLKTDNPSFSVYEWLCSPITYWIYKPLGREIALNPGYPRIENDNLKSSSLISWVLFCQPSPFWFIIWRERNWESSALDGDCLQESWCLDPKENDKEIKRN